MKQRRFKCSYCDKRFVYETGFIKHKCKAMIREEEFKSIIGQGAWECYSTWMKKSKRFIPSPETFMTSSLYPHFIKFAKFSKRVHIADITSYINIMISENNIPPSMWILPEAHSLYLNKLDRLIPPMKMVSISVNTLFDLAEAYEVPIENIFEVVAPNEIITLIQLRNLSPWLLLKSVKFLNFINTQTTKEEYIILETLIKFDFWYAKFSKHKKEGEQIKKIVAELNL